MTGFDELQGHDPKLEEEAAGGEAVGDVNADGEVTGYEALTKAELADELERRGLPKSGNVPDLIERLEADDAEQAKATAAGESTDSNT